VHDRFDLVRHAARAADGDPRRPDVSLRTSAAADLAPHASPGACTAHRASDAHAPEWWFHAAPRSRFEVEVAHAIWQREEILRNQDSLARFRYRPRMHRIWLAAALLAACGVDPSEDDRPRTLHYITTAVLKPYCAAAQCHSSFRQEKNRAYDTVKIACQSLVVDVIPGDPEGSFLHQVLVRRVDRMPYDQPMAEVDRLLLDDWIMIGAPGLPATEQECK
jgi:hypothetical protein